jgi:hypothetical protein
MTKKEMHSAINKQVYKWLDEKNIPFELEMGGRVTVMVGEDSDDWFDYHQTHHTVCGLNWMSGKAESIMGELEGFIDGISNKIEQESERSI